MVCCTVPIAGPPPNCLPQLHFEQRNGLDFQMESRALDREIELSRLVDAACDHYEHLWRSNGAPRFSEFLEAVPEEGRENLVRELVRVKCELLLASGQPIERAEFLSEIPAYEDLVKQVVDDCEKEANPSEHEIQLPDTHSLGDRTWPSPRAVTGRALQPPKSLGRFQLVRQLGRGGNGTVFLARDSSLDREVALKIPRRELVETEKLRTRFLREARAAASLHHAHICPVYDVGEIDGWPYIVMRYIEGKSLAEAVKENGYLDQDRAVGIVRDLALALARTHELGIVHRDLKPSNVMLDEDGQPVIMDFGLASRRSADEEQITQQGEIFGTPSYMSPEQAQGDTENVGSLSDVYSLGAILYELLTGEPPFKGSATSILIGIVQEQPDRIEHLREDVSPELCEICRRAMAKNPSERFGSMEDFAQALNQFADTTSRADSKKSRSSSRRKFAGVAVAATLLVLAIVSAVVYLSTDFGTLKIQTDDQHVKIKVSRAGDTVGIIDTATGTELSLRSGRYDLKLIGNRNDVKLSSDRIALERGGHRIVEVVFLEDDGKPSGDSKQVVPSETNEDDEQHSQQTTGNAQSAAIAFVRRSNFSEKIKQALSKLIRSQNNQLAWVTESDGRVLAIAAMARPKNDAARRATSILAETAHLRALAEMLLTESLAQKFAEDGLTHRDALKEAVMLASGQLRFAGTVKGYEQQAGLQGDYLVGLVVAPVDQVAIAAGDDANRLAVRSAYGQVISSQAKKLMKSENWDEAIALWLHLHQIKLTSKEIYLDAARCFYHMGKPGDAVMLIDQALKTVGTRTDASYLFAMGDLAAEIDTEESREIAVRAYQAASKSLEFSVTP